MTRTFHEEKGRIGQPTSSFSCLCRCRINSACVAFYYHNKCHLVFQNGPTGIGDLTSSENGRFYVKGTFEISKHVLTH